MISRLKQLLERLDMKHENSILEAFPTRLVQFLLEHGVQLSIEKTEVGIVLDVHTGMKSHLHLSYNALTGYTAYMRYNESLQVETIQDVIYAVKKCRHGRDYASFAWEYLINHIPEINKDPRVYEALEELK